MNVFVLRASISGLPKYQPQRRVVNLMQRNVNSMTQCDVSGVQMMKSVGMGHVECL